MIEKLDSKMECVELTVLEKKAECLDFEAARKLNLKINELVDAVNGMLYWHENLPRFWQNLSQKENTENKEPADPYAEQRKWIGKLCWFWISGKNNKNHYGKLKQIDPFSKHHYTDEDLTCWDFCEPVKPDDDIIYKGGNNE